MASALYSNDAIIAFNVGGTRFTTSRQTLTWIPDSFFSSLLSGRISSLKDSSGAIFIDRDPEIFKAVLNYLRTKQVCLKNVDIAAFKHEAQFYGLGPLVKRLTLCDELDECVCGDVLFHGYLPAPPFPLAEKVTLGNSDQPMPEMSSAVVRTHSRNLSDPSSATGGANSSTAGRPPYRTFASAEAKFRLPPPIGSPNSSPGPSLLLKLADVSNSSAKLSCDMPSGAIVVKCDESKKTPAYSSIAFPGGDQAFSPRTNPSHSPAASLDAPNQAASLAGVKNLANSTSKSAAGCARSQSVVAPNSLYRRGHVRAASEDFRPARGHKRVSSDLTRQIRLELSAAMKHATQGPFLDPNRVHLIRAHHNWIACAYSHFVCCSRMKDSIGWHLCWTSPRTEAPIAHLALNAKPGSQVEKMLAAALTNNTIHLWAINEDGLDSKIGVFSLSVVVDTLFFIGSQLVALSQTGKVGIWHAMTQNWQIQDVVPISSYDTAGSFLLLGCLNGAIYYIDMQKFPLRMKDNDLLVTELYRDPNGDVITSISVYLTPKTSLCGNWIEIAYGTNGGAVRVIVQHPETVGHGPQLFQTFNVHRAPIVHVALTTSHLISVCSEYNHVRSWTVTRFRGMISTQPGSTPCASFKVLTLESADPGLDADPSNVGPFGEQDGEQVFIQKIVPETNQLYVRLASTGDRVCVIRSVDGSSITAFLVHECEGSNRMGSRPRRYLFTGHANGNIQMWDLTTALDMYAASKEKGNSGQSIFPQGPTPNELLHLIDGCEVTCSSLSTTPSMTPAASCLNLHQQASAALSGRAGHALGDCAPFSKQSSCDPNF